MKLVTYDDGSGNEIAGILTRDGSGVVPLTSIEPGFDSLQAFIEALDAGSLAQARALLDEEPTATPLVDVRLLAPLPRPVQIRDVLCFLDHMRNAGRVATQMQGGNPDDYVLPPAFESAPRYYKANRLCVIGTDQDVLWPDGCDMLDYELELPAHRRWEREALFMASRGHWTRVFGRLDFALLCHDLGTPR